MTPAEFKTIRESLGLSAQWIANHLGVSLRTVRYWEAGERVNIPDKSAVNLADMDAGFGALVEQALVNPPSVLVRYHTDAGLWRTRPDLAPLPAVAHAALLARIRTAILARGGTVSIEYDS